MGHACAEQTGCAAVKQLQQATRHTLQAALGSRHVDSPCRHSAESALKAAGRFRVSQRMAPAGMRSSSHCRVVKRLAAPASHMACSYANDANDGHWKVGQACRGLAAAVQAVGWRTRAAAMNLSLAVCAL